MTQFKIRPILDGISLGIIVALIPSALLGQLLTALLPHAPFLKVLLIIVNLMTALLPVAAGIGAGMLCRLTPIQTASLALSALAGAGNWQFTSKGFLLRGSGDVINVMLMLIVGVGLLQVIGDRLQAYTILVLPTLFVVVVGGIGYVTHPLVAQVMSALGQVLAHITALTPIVMGALIAAIFATMILSPISTVGLATAISLSGVAAGAANLGITACGFALAIYGSQTNGLGVNLVPILGSPKSHMSNVLAKPIIFVPIILNAAILGALGAILDIEGTPMSAGFGFSGLIGPLAAQANGSQWVTIGLMFVILPLAGAFITRFIFSQQLKWFQSTDLSLEFR